ncbi:MAG: hypothetical protein K9N47_03375 [Prosthecobacter sp.]|uniref:hypothetical protein n=1 Tax=Prosthecobacter sp. TaxID=1965333 RepID=UPI0025EE6F18|nr:hypothetical protein [Prosthecobacter sp.]MCF7785134.1 hypothetical protein [Prosthecobacter sp.]
MTFPSIKLRAFNIVLCALVAAGIAVALQVHRIGQKPREFRSQAKLVNGSLMYCGATEWLDLPEEFYAGMIESLESEEMKRRSWERLAVSNPNLTKTHIKIHANRTRGSRIFTVFAMGSEPLGTKIFLDALLDEFIAWRMSVVDEAAARALHAYLQKASQSHQMEQPAVILERFLSMVEAASRGADQEVLRPYLEALQRPLKDLPGLPRSENAVKAAPDQTTMTTTLDQNVRELEARIQSYLAEAAELGRITANHAVEQEKHQKQLDQLELFRGAFFAIDPTQIAIQERAIPATEYIEDWRVPVAAAAGGGGLLGALIGLLLSLMILRAPSKALQFPSAV